MVAKLPKPIRKIWKMLQCVKEKIKSADEKLRSIGSKPQQQQHQHPQSPPQPHRIQHHHHLPYQTQQYHHHQQQQQQQRHHQYQQRQQQQQHRLQQQQQRHQQQQQQRQHQYHHQQQQQPPPPPLQQQHPQQEPAPPPVPSRDGDDNMAERRVQLRQGRRERRRDGDNADDLKRRSRSEGPSGRRIIQSMDVGSNSAANNNNNNNSGSNHRRGHSSFERRQQEVGVARGGGGNRVGEGGGGRISPTCSDDEGGGGGGGFYNRDPPSASDSDSDSDRMRWTKNPLIVRRVKKNKADKRNSNGADNNTSNSSPSYTQLGQRNTNRESWVYLAPEGIPVPPANQDPQQQQQQKGDGGGSNSGSMKNKYQKMEENRKKRIDIAVTSDEENTPASRISRLRQRALQGGLGNQPPRTTDNSRVTVSDHNGWGPQGARVAGGPMVMSDQGRRQNRVGQPPGSQYGQQAVAAQPQAYRSNVAQPAGVYAHQNALNNQSRHTAAASQPSQPVSVPQRNVSDAYHQPMPSPVRQSLVRPFTDRGNPDAASSPTTGRKQFHTIPEPQLAFRAVHNSSPEINVKRFNPAVRVPSADSIYDSANYTPEPEPGNNRHSGGGRFPAQRTFTQVNPPSQDVMEVQRVTAVQHHQAPANQRGQSAATPYNEVVELRLKSARVIDRPLSQTFSDPRTSGRLADAGGGGFHSDDSLDELFESNIQYLEREIGASGSRKSLTPVTRTSSLPDPRKSPHPSPQPGTPSRPRVTVSGQQSVRSSVQAAAPLQQPQPPSQQPQQSNKSELHFRVPLSPQAKNLISTHPPPQIQIAEENDWSDSAYHPSAKAYTFGVAPKERKYSYDSTPLVHSSPRPGSEYYDRDDMSKSDTQLNAAIVTPTYRGSMLHPNFSAGRGCISDQNLTVEQTQGMFSDVEYDIEVSERVKKWEKFMKKPDFTSGGEGSKKPLLLTPIEERGEGERDSLMMPSEIRRSIRSMAQQQQQQPQQYPMTTTTSTAVAHSELISMKPANSDPTLHLTGDARMLSKESNLHRFFQVVQDPTAGLQVGPNLSHSTSSVYIDLPQKSPQLFSRTATVYQPGGLMSPEELRKHMLANQRSRAEAESGTLAAPDTPETSKRLSRYQDEIEEMKSVKHQSVHNLRRRFDDGKTATNTTTTASEDETNFDARIAKVSPTHKDSSNQDWSRMITGLEDRIRDMEVWSPNMESTQGNVVSIERVKARTLQTIPFSEDPFWKEIEEMTTFDPNSLGGHLAVLEETIKPVAALPPPESSLSPHGLSAAGAHPRQPSGVSMKDRLQRSKSLYTPNITPLTISVDPYTGGGKSSSLERGATGADKYSGPNALDDVLEDIRTSLERKPLSPKRRAAGESSDSHRSSPGGHGWASEIIRTRSERLRGHAPEAAGPTAASSSVWDSTTSSYGSHVAQPPVAITVSSNQRPQPQPQHATAPAAPALAVPAGGMTAGHYHLDPLLLKQKLLSTGLVEDDKPEVPVRGRVPPMSSSTFSSVPASKPVAVAPPQAVVRSVVAPTQRAAPAGVRSSQQREKLSQVNNSMEELRQLAVNVEQKIEMIKSRLLTADDQNLDKILLSLRKFAPSAGPHSPTGTLNMDDFYHKKKTKLEDALGELERIYSNLDLNNDMLMDRAERRDYPSYRTKPGSAGSSGVSVTASIGSGSSPHPTSRAKASSSVFISPITPVATVQAETSPYSVHRATAKAESEKKAHSEFDAISKSFQAIIDEVNKTASLVSNASPQQSRTQPPLPEIKELQSKMYASREQQRHAASPETHRRALNITVNSQGSKPVTPAYNPGPTPKSPPAVAPKPFRAQAPACSSQKGPMSSPFYASISVSSTANASPQPPITSVVRAEVARPAPEKREPRVRQRFRTKTAAQEKEDAALKRARSKSSPTITLQDLAAGSKAEAESTASGEGTPTAKTQVNFQIEPAAGTKPLGGPRRPPLHLDTARAQQGAVVELQLKPPAMFQDQDSSSGKPEPIKDNQSSRVLAQPTVVKPMVSTTAPPLDSKTVVYSGSSPTPVSSTTASTVSVAAKVDNNTSSSESSAEGRERKGKQRMGRGVAMMVELFSSSDDERLRRSHPLHTRSAPDLSAEPAGSDDSINVPKDAANLRPAELSRVLQQKSESESLPGSPAVDRKAGSGQNQVNAVQNDSVPSPQSPSSKPPFHPFRRQDRGSESSPQRSVPASVSSESSSTAITGTTTTTTTSASTTSANSASTKVTTATTTATTSSSNTSATTASNVVLRRPAKKPEPATNKKVVAGDDDDDANNEEDDEFQERPRSFHELLSSFEPDPNRLAKLSSLRKCASEDLYPGQTVLTRRIFRSSSFTSEPDLHSQRDEAPTPQEVRQWTKL